MSEQRKFTPPKYRPEGSSNPAAGNEVAEPHKPDAQRPGVARGALVYANLALLGGAVFGTTMLANRADRQAARRLRLYDAIDRNNQVLNNQRERDKQIADAAAARQRQKDLDATLRVQAKRDERDKKQAAEAEVRELVDANKGAARAQQIAERAEGDSLKAAQKALALANESGNQRAIDRANAALKRAVEKDVAAKQQLEEATKRAEDAQNAVLRRQTAEAQELQKQKERQDRQKEEYDAWVESQRIQIEAEEAEKARLIEAATKLRLEKAEEIAKAQEKAEKDAKDAAAAKIEADRQEAERQAEGKRKEAERDKGKGKGKADGDN